MSELGKVGLILLMAKFLGFESLADLIPDGLYRQMTTCQTAANEFLRQFWSAMYPPPTDAPTVTIATPAQRMAKATKMIAYISKTHEKVDALLKTAQAHDIDPSQVQIVSSDTTHGPTVFDPLPLY